MVKFMWRKVKVKKKYTLRKEMTSLMLRTSACTLLSAVLAILYVFFSFFFQKTQEDIEYVLKISVSHAVYSRWSNIYST